jgi:flagellar hook-basal body complex protein FliE
MPVEAITAIGPEWTIGDVGRVGTDSAPAGAPDGAGFGDMLAGQIDNLQSLQTEAASQSQALATGQAADVSDVVMAVERAQLSMQLAASVRDKSVEAFQEIFRTQV